MPFPRDEAASNLQNVLIYKGNGNFRTESVYFVKNCPITYGTKPSKAVCIESLVQLSVM